MDNAQILKKAIEKATNNGFKMITHKHFCEIGRSEIGIPVSVGAYESIIYDHEFAKAFWGDKCPLAECEDGDRPHDWVWQNHLKEMVLEPEPLKYLERFIK